MKLNPLNQGVGRLGWIGVLLGALGFLFVALVLMKGDENADEQGIAPARDVMVCLDVSRSMLARDIGPDRLSRAKSIVADLIQSGGIDRIGLVLFAGEAKLVYPLTSDHGAVAEVMETAHPYSVTRGGSVLAAPLDICREKVFTSDDRREHWILLITDGEDADGQGALSAAGLWESGVRVVSVSVGTHDGARIPVLGDDEVETFLKDGEGGVVVTRPDHEALKSIARAGGGHFIEVVDDAAIGLKLQAGAETLGSESPAGDRQAWIGLSLVCWLLALACGVGGRL